MTPIQAHASFARPLQSTASVLQAPHSQYTGLVVGCVCRRTLTVSAPHAIIGTELDINKWQPNRQNLPLNGTAGGRKTIGAALLTKWVPDCYHTDAPCSGQTGRAPIVVENKGQAEAGQSFPCSSPTSLTCSASSDIPEELGESRPCGSGAAGGRAAASGSCQRRRCAAGHRELGTDGFEQCAVIACTWHRNW